MTDPDPAHFYTGLIAELYGRLRSSTPDPTEYADFIAESGEPALELGCGDGDPLLDLVRSGLDVDGVDSSGDMLDRLCRAAQAAGLQVRVHRQRMQDLDLPRRYRSIFLAGPTFTVLPDDDAALHTLRRIREHLHPDGTALVPLWVPPPTPPEGLGVFRQAGGEGPESIRVAVVAERYDLETRTRRSLLRYERRRPGAVAGLDPAAGMGADVAAGHADADSDVDAHVDAVEREWLIHWYTPGGFVALADRAGLAVLDLTDESGQAPAEDCAYFTARLARSSSAGS